MIKDNIKNSENYRNLPKGVRIGLEYLLDTDFSAVENGKYEIRGKDVFVIIQDYNTKPIEEGKFEAHKKHTDIQYIIEGKEQIGVGNIDKFLEITGYDEAKDIVFLTQRTGANPEFIELKENEFAIFTPQDAHMPSIAVNHSFYVRKAVVKVLV